MDNVVSGSSVVLRVVNGDGEVDKEVSVCNVIGTSGIIVVATFCVDVMAMLFLSSADIVRELLLDIVELVVNSASVDDAWVETNFTGEIVVEESVISCTVVSMARFIVVDVVG